MSNAYQILLGILAVFQGSPGNLLPPPGGMSNEERLLYQIYKNLIIGSSGGGGGGTVTSVFNRTGAIVAQVGDYSIGQITGAGALASLNTVGTVQIDNSAVTLAKIQSIASSRILGVINGPAAPAELTGTQVTTLLDVFTSVLQGVVPASGGGTTNFLRADGTWAAPSGGGTTDADIDATHTPLNYTGGAKIVNHLAGIDNELGNLANTVNVFQSEPESSWFSNSFGSSLLFYMGTSIKDSMFIENFSTEVPITPANNDGDTVGFMYEQSINSLLINSQSSTRSPQLKSSANKSTFLHYTGGTNGMRHVVEDSVSVFNVFHGPSPQGTIAFKLGMPPGTDGTLQVILNNGAETTANLGFRISRETSNNIRVLITKGVAGVPVADYVSTFTITEADGFKAVMLEFTGGNATLSIGDASGIISENIPLAPGVVGDAQQDLVIASNLTGTQTYNIFLDDVLFLDRVFNTQEKIDYRSINYDRGSVPFTPRILWDIAFFDTNTLWSDITKTTNSVNGGIVRVVDSKDPGIIERTLSSIDVASSPIYSANELNGNGACVWDGNDNLNFSETVFKEKGGNWTFFITIKNRNSALGSNYIKGTGTYAAITGDNYSSNDNNIVNGVPSPYTLLHLTNGDTSGFLSKAKPDGEYITLAYRRKGNVISSFNELGFRQDKISIEAFNFNKMGEAFNPGWDLDGSVYSFQAYAGSFDDFSIRSKIAEITNKVYQLDSSSPNTSGIVNSSIKFKLATANNLAQMTSDLGFSLSSGIQIDAKAKSANIIGMNVSMNVLNAASSGDIIFQLFEFPGDSGVQRAIGAGTSKHLFAYTASIGTTIYPLISDMFPEQPIAITPGTYLFCDTSPVAALATITEVTVEILVEYRY